MPKSAHYFLAVAATAILSNTSDAETLEVTDTISLHGVAIETTDDMGGTTSSDVVRTDDDGNIDNSAIYVTANQNPGALGTYQYGIRERVNFTQPERQWRSFLQFDVSTIPATELADPNFSATFTIDYVTHLNNLNAGLNVGLGQIVDGAWDSTTTLPTIAFSENSTDLGILITDAAANPTALPGLTVDITNLVRGWADGSIDNFGLTFTVPEGDPGVSNATYFSNATIVTSTDPLLSADDQIEVTNITRATDGIVTLDFNSPFGNVDVYRSTDLLDFGASPIASNITPGIFIDESAVPLPTAFYLLVPTGQTLP